MWIKSAFDGHKFVCADDFSSVIYNEGCLVYSFGVGSDASFEEAVADIGKAKKAIKVYRVTHLLANLGWVDFDLRCFTILPSCSACQFPISPGRTRQRVEQPKSKSTQPRFAKRCVTL